MSQTKQSDFTIRIGDLVPENQELAEVKPDDDLSQAMKVMKCNNYSQLPVRDETGKLEGVISWRSIGERTTDSQSTAPNLVRECMDTQVEAISLDCSLFEAIREIEDRDYIVVKDSNSEIIGIVTASDLANRFEKFSRAFAYIREIDLRLRNCFISKGIELSSPPRVPGFKEYINNLTKIQDIIRRVTVPQQFSCELSHVRSIRNKIMHFKNEKLGEANDEDIHALLKVLNQLRELE